MEIKKIFFGQLNTDTGSFALPDTHYLNAVNVNIKDGRDNSAGDVTPATGNKLFIPNTWKKNPTSKVIGSCVDEANDRIIYIFTYHNDDEDRWDSYMVSTFKLAGADVEGVVFDFNDFQDGRIEYSPDDHIDMVIKGDFVLWASEGHPVRKLNVLRGLKRNQPIFDFGVDPYPDFIDTSDITLIKKPPKYPPHLSTRWLYDEGNNNYVLQENYWISGKTSNDLNNDSFQFATRFIYNDGDISTMSPFSKMVQPNLNKNKAIKIYYSENGQSTPPDVKTVELLAKKGMSGKFKVINKVDAAVYDMASFNFYNNYYGETLSEDYVSMPYSAVPIQSSTVESVKNRIVVGDNIEGYDTPDTPKVTVSTTTSGLDIDNMFSDISFNLNAWADEPNIYCLHISRGVGDVDDGKKNFIRSSSYALAIYINDPTLPDELNGTYLYKQVTSGLEAIYWSKENDGNYLNQWVVDALKNGSFSWSDFVRISDKNIITEHDYNKNGWSDQGDYKEYKDVRLFSKPWWDTPGGDPEPPVWNGDPASLKNLPIYVYNTIVDGEKVFRNGENLKFGVVLKDEFKRRSFVIPGEDQTDYSNGGSAVIDTFNYNFLTRSTGFGVVKNIKVSLPEDYTLPDWVDTASIVRTKSKSNFFMQFHTNKILYAVKRNAVDIKYVDETELPPDGMQKLNSEFYKYADAGDWVVCASNNTNNDINPDGIAVNVKDIVPYNIGYEFTKGDVLTISEPNGFKASVNIIGMFGDWIIADPVQMPYMVFPPSLHVLASPGTDDWNLPIKWEYYIDPQPINYHCEISSKNTVSDEYYEIGWELPVIDNKIFWGADILVSGNAYMRKYDDKFVQVMNRGDSTTFWDTDLSRPNIITPATPSAGRVEKPTSFRWGGNYFKGTKINDLAMFNAFDEKTLPPEIGSIKKLVFTSKMAETGNVLLVIGENESMSVYIDESIMTDAQGSENVLATTHFVGTVRELKGGFGTTHPESVVEYGGNVYWWDAKRKTPVRYSNAGLFPLAKYSTQSFFDKIETKDVKMYGGFNPKTNEYYLKVPPVNSDTITYPTEWDGKYICDDDTVVDSGFAVTWGGRICQQTDDGFGATWGGFTCEKIEVDYQQGVTWADHSCSVTRVEGLFSILWGRYVCVQAEQTFSAQWFDYICEIAEYSNTYVADWSDKICVNTP